MEDEELVEQSEPNETSGGQMPRVKNSINSNNGLMRGIGHMDPRHTTVPDKSKDSNNKPSIKDKGGKAVENAGKGVKGAGQGLETAGKGAESLGKGMQTAGKGIQNAGGAAGNALSAIPYVGAPLGGAVKGASTAVGKGAEAAGKGTEAAGKAAQNTGKGMKKSGDALKNAGSSAQKDQATGKKNKNKSRNALPESLVPVKDNNVSPMKLFAGGNFLANFKNLPTQVKRQIIIRFAFPALIFLLLLFMLIIIVLIVGVTVMTSSDCDKSEYSNSVGNSADVDTFMCSMNAPLKSVTVDSLFGWRDFTLTQARPHMHEGVDLRASCGTNVYAAADGEVVLASVSGGYGNALQIKHSDNISTWYAHLSSYKVNKGDKVKKGDLVAISGGSGGYPCHLHFEVRNNNKAVSPNPYFGYSDKGFEDCITSGTFVGKCGIHDGRRGSSKIKNDEKSQVCNVTKNYFNEGKNDDCCESSGSSGSSSSSGNLRSFINYFEGTGPTCDSTHYKAYQNSGDRLTIGHGVTTDDLPSLSHVGQCISKSTVDAAQEKGIEKKRKGLIASKFAGVKLSQNQEDAMTSMAYNGCATFFSGIAKAAGNDDLKGVWSAMKGCINKGTIFENGLKSRRKAEFALYVTGDYSTDTIRKYMKTYSAVEYDNYDSEGILAKKTSGSSSSCSSSSVYSTGDRKAVVEVAQKEYAAWRAGGANHCSMISKYLSSCGQGGCGLAWCAGFTSYVLRTAGVADKIGLPKSCIANLMNGAKNVTIHKAGGSYTPQPGDVITFDWSGGRSSHSHVGIVEYVEGKTVHTIEGNSSHAINKRTYPVDSKFIYEYVSY